MFLKGSTGCEAGRELEHMPQKLHSTMLIRQSIPVLLTFLTLLQICFAANLVHFCKCFCGSNSTIFEIAVDEPKPCSNCTKQFCLDNVEDGLCDGIADETCPSNDFRTVCFGKFC